MKFAVSSTVRRGRPLRELIEFVKQNDIILEFSSGLKFKKDLIDTYFHADCKKMVHNYFPPPEVPFVLNLASANDATLRASLDHVINCLNITAESNASYYSVHAGFCLDPRPEDLGKPLHAQMHHKKEVHWDIFLKAIETCLARAKTLGVSLLIENNVLAPFNLTAEGKNPLLCCNEEELTKMIKNFDDSALGILMDTGHWKVSGQTLNFDIHDNIKSLFPYIKAVHHSDNDSFADTNEPFFESYWFLQHMKYIKDAVHVLEVHDQSDDQVFRQRELLIQSAGDRTNKAISFLSKSYLL